MNWLRHNWPEVIELTVDHLFLCLPAIAISIVVALPIGRLAYRHPVIGGPLLGLASLMYAIPALPLLIIIPAIVGTPLRSSATMIVALSVYGTALLVRTAADAFSSVSPTTRQAAVALGHSPRSVLWRVDLPLSIPVVVSGVRVVVASTVGLVTIGTLIGVSSLGNLLTNGFQRGIWAEVATGVVATVVLAVALDALVLLLGWIATPWSRTVPARNRAAA